MQKEIVLWLVLLITFLVVEAFTVGLTSIWLAGGALVALIAAVLGLDFIGQLIVFIVISSLLLYFTRPFAVKYINAHHEKTNYDQIIGTVIRVTEKVDNLAQTGRGVCKGMDWTVRMKDEGVTLEAGELAKVVKISGVKLIVEPWKEEE